MSFAYASISDIKSREVSNWVWMILAPIGLALTASEYLLSPETFPALPTLISIAIVSILSLALFFIGFVGGADAKAFVAIALTMPLYPTELTPLLGATFLLFPISVLTNSILFSALSAPFMLLWNLLRKLRGERLFQFFDGESGWRKFLTLLTCVQVDISSINPSSKISFAENLVANEKGIGERKLRPMYRIAEDDTIEGDLKTYRDLGVTGKIWVTPLLPMMVFITLGIICGLFVGDILLMGVGGLIPL